MNAKSYTFPKTKHIRLHHMHLYIHAYILTYSVDYRRPHDTFAARGSLGSAKESTEACIGGSPSVSAHPMEPIS